LVDVAIYPSVAAAHDGLLHILAMVSESRLPFAAERGLDLGEVAFAGFSEIIAALLFVRRNVLVDIRSVGSTPVAVTALAQDIDAQIQALPRAD
jgi:hypothetical protein